MPARDGVGEVVGYAAVNRVAVAAHQARDALHSSEERFEKALRASPAVSCLVRRRDGLLVEANDRFFELLGYARAEVVGTVPPVELFAHAAEEGLHSDEMERRGRVRCCEADIRGKDGTVRHVLFSAELIQFSGEQHVLAAMVDITDSESAVVALRGAQEKLQAALVAGRMGTWSWDIDSNTFSWDASASRILGLNPEAAAVRRGELLRFLVCSADRQRAEEAVLDAVSGGALRPIELRLSGLGGSQTWVSVEGRRTQRKDGVSGSLVVGMIVDVTERKRAEEALGVVRAQLAAALEMGGMGTWSWDPLSGRARVDDIMLQIWGRSRTDLREGAVRLPLGPIHPDDQDRECRWLDSVLRGGAVASSSEYRICWPNGSTRWVALTIRVERDEGGRAIQLVGVGMDITTKKAEESARVRTQKLDALGTLAAGVAHDFNNVLLAIRGNTNLAISEISAEHPAAERMNAVARAADRAVDLVHRILAFSRPEEEQQVCVLDLAPVVAEALQLVRATHPAMIEIRLVPTGELPGVLADPTQVHQIVVNLVTNAAHAIGARKGLVELQLEPWSIDGASAPTEGVREGAYVRLIVRDTGSGMTSETIERIFEPFFTTKARGQGTGLGLSVVRGIVQSYGGSIDVESEPGVGTTFCLLFPVSEAKGPVVRSMREQARAGAGEHVLYVDDEPELVSLVRRMVLKMGYEVTVFSDPNLALAAVRARPHSFDAVVTDVSMPEMTGFELARSILESRPDMPILITGGYVHEEDTRAARSIGAWGVIPKSRLAEELGPALGAMLGG